MCAKPLYLCAFCGQKIPSARVNALALQNLPEEARTCVKHSQTTPRQGLYLGEVGTSELLLVDKVYNDSVRSIFRGAKKEAEKTVEDEESEEPASSTGCEDYDPKELNYYTSNDEQLDPEEKIEIIKRHQP